MTCTAPSGVGLPSTCADLRDRGEDEIGGSAWSRLCWFGTIGRNSAPRAVSAAIGAPRVRSASGTQGAGLQRQRVQHAAHHPERLVDDLVLLDRDLPRKDSKSRSRRNGRRRQPDADVTSASGIAALIIDSISWASIGIQHLSVRCFESRRARATVTAKPSVYALLGHPSRHYIPGPNILNPLRPRRPVTTR